MVDVEAAAIKHLAEGISLASGFIRAKKYLAAGAQLAFIAHQLGKLPACELKGKALELIHAVTNAGFLLEDGDLRGR